MGIDEWTLLSWLRLRRELREQCHILDRPSEKSCDTGWPKCCRPHRPGTQYLPPAKWKAISARFIPDHPIHSSRHSTDPALSVPIPSTDPPNIRRTLPPPVEPATPNSRLYGLNVRPKTIVSVSALSIVCGTVVFAITTAPYPVRIS